VLCDDNHALMHFVFLARERLECTFNNQKTAVDDSM